MNDLDDAYDAIESGIYAEPYYGDGSKRIADGLIALATLRVSVLDRAALTRALTAQAWAVACACFMCAKPRPAYLAAVLARLPAPADLAAQLLGDV